MRELAAKNEKQKAKIERSQRMNEPEPPKPAPRIQPRESNLNKNGQKLRVSDNGFDFKENEQV